MPRARAREKRIIACLAQVQLRTQKSKRTAVNVWFEENVVEEDIRNSWGFPLVSRTKLCVAELPI